MNATEEIEAHIYKKFEIQQKLGKGAYGVVWKALDKKTKKIVALKKVFEAFHNATDAQRTFREVMILQELSGHDNLVKLLNVIRAENNKDLYLVFDFMETDLHAVIKADILKKVHKQYIIYQLLRGLKYIHSGEIIHRDLKPSNILINSECHIKIADFGLARSILSKSEEVEPVMTEYVATRWYRAPEIVLGSNRYSKAVDVWSVGCILAELINGKALFPGVSTMNQIELILEVLGKPSKEDILSIESENALSIIQNIALKGGKSFSAFFKDTSPETVDFLQRCLEFNPDKRMTIEDALAHPFVQQFRDKRDEPVLSEPVIVPIDDNQKLPIKEYRDALYDDIVNKKKEERKVWRQHYMQQLARPAEIPAPAPVAPPPVAPRPPPAARPSVGDRRATLFASATPAQSSFTGLRPAPKRTPPRPTVAEKLEGELRRPAVKAPLANVRRPVDRPPHATFGHSVGSFKAVGHSFKDGPREPMKRPEVVRPKAESRPTSSQPFNAYTPAAKFQNSRLQEQYPRLFSNLAKK